MMKTVDEYMAMLKTPISEAAVRELIAKILEDADDAIGDAVSDYIREMDDRM